MDLNNSELYDFYYSANAENREWSFNMVDMGETYIRKVLLDGKWHFYSEMVKHGESPFKTDSDTDRKFLGTTYENNISIKTL